MPARVRVIFEGNDTYLTVSSLTDTADDSIVTTATVTATLFEDDKTTEVPGPTWPLTLSHIAAGLYRVVLPDTTGFRRGHDYHARILANDGAGRLGSWLVPARVQERIE